MKERSTVRLLFLGPDNRLLLMRADDPAVKKTGNTKGSIWFTLGGGVEPGESVIDAACREALEETGQQDIEIGPEVWYGEQILTIRDVPTLLKETFIVVHTKKSDTSSDLWTADEKKVIKELRWWSLVELQTSTDTIFPKVLPGLLPDILDKRYPAPLLSIQL